MSRLGGGGEGGYLGRGGRRDEGLEMLLCICDNASHAYTATAKMLSGVHVVAWQGTMGTGQFRHLTILLIRHVLVSLSQLRVSREMGDDGEGQIVQTVIVVD
jgi:hypothetical protein